MNVDAARNFGGVVFHVLLDGAKGSHNHPDCCCFKPPRSLNLNFQVFVFVKLFCGFDWGVGIEGCSHANEKAVLSFLFFSTMSSLLAAVVLSVCMGMSHRLFNIIIIIVIIITVIIIKVLIIHLLSYLV